MNHFRSFFVVFIDQFVQYVKIDYRFQQQIFEKNESIFANVNFDRIINLHLSIIIDVIHVVVVIYNALRSC